MPILSTPAIASHDSQLMELPIVTAPSIVIAGSDARFPVRRIFCVGQNYPDHAREMGAGPERRPPFFFSKPADAVVASGSQLAFPAHTQDLHHEVELVVALGHGGSDIAATRALALIYGWTVGLDLTRRDLQSAAKKGGLPWDMAKGFDQSAPLGDLRRGVPPAEASIELYVNDSKRQSGNLRDMIWAIPEIIATLSTYVQLAPGDLIFTGTPAGVGPLRRGDTVRGFISDIGVTVRFLD